MGLDMYLYKRIASNTPQEEIGSWRKHANLHGYMETLYYSRGGTEVFNCIPLKLEKSDCKDIIERSKAHNFDTAEGFFWGASVGEDDEDTIRFMEEAIQAIDDGYTIYYDSWW